MDSIIRRYKSAAKSLAEKDQLTRERARSMRKAFVREAGEDHLPALDATLKELMSSPTLKMGKYAPDNRVECDTCEGEGFEDDNLPCEDCGGTGKISPPPEDEQADKPSQPEQWKVQAGKDLQAGLEEPESQAYALRKVASNLEAGNEPFEGLTSSEKMSAFTAIKAD